MRRSFMSLKVDPGVMKDLKKFGMKDAGKCYHCGNCTAICPLAEKDNTFPRRMIKYAQMGLTEKIMQSPEPWLCYYCGDCSDQCPRGADPGEAMMAMRRYLTSKYDWTGFSRKFYISHTFEIIAVVIVAVPMLVLEVPFAKWAHLAYRPVAIYLIKVKEEYNRRLQAVE